VDAEPGTAGSSEVSLALCGRSLAAGYLVGGRIFAALHSGRVHDSWRQLAGGRPACEGGAESMVIATREPEIFLGFIDKQHGDRVTVKTATTEGWHTLGQSGFSAAAAHLSLTVDDDGTPFVAYAATAHAGRVSVMRYEAASGRWVAVGGLTVGVGGLENAASVQLAFVSHVPYVAYIGEGASRARALSVMRYDGGTTWTELAPSGAAAVAMPVSVSMLATSLQTDRLHSGQGASTDEHDDDDDDEHRPLSLVVACNTQDGPGGARAVRMIELHVQGAPLGSDGTRWRDAIGSALRAAVGGNAQWAVIGMAAHDHIGSLHVSVLHVSVLQLQTYALDWQKAGPPVFNPVGGAFQLAKLPRPGLLSLAVEGHGQPVLAGVDHALASSSSSSAHQLSVMVHHQKQRHVLHPHALKPESGGHYLDSELMTGLLGHQGDDDNDDHWDDDWDDEDWDEDEEDSETVGNDTGPRPGGGWLGLVYAHPLIAAGILAAALLGLSTARHPLRRRAQSRCKRSSDDAEHGPESVSGEHVISIAQLTPRQGRSFGSSEDGSSFGFLDSANIPN
jgi:hypothetical protein